MDEVLAVTGTARDPEVAGLAGEVARLLGARVRELPVTTAGQVVAAAAGPGVAAVVLRVESSPGHGFWDIATTLDVPLVVLPTGAGSAPRPIEVVLLPLDGTAEAARAVSPVVHRLLDTGTSVVATHVFDPSTVPAFWDQAAHSEEPWRDEFLRRHLPRGVTLDLRRGLAAEEVQEAAAAQGAGLVLLSWAQQPTDHRARTVRLLVEGDLPVMLVGTRGDQRPHRDGT